MAAAARSIDTQLMLLKGVVIRYKMLACLAGTLLKAFHVLNHASALSD